MTALRAPARLLGLGGALGVACGSGAPAAQPPVAERSVPSSAASQPPAPRARTLLAAAQPVFPAPGAPRVCIDAELSLALADAARVGSSGSIRVFDVAAPEAPVAELDVGTAGFVDAIGGRTFRIANPVVVEGARVSVRLPTGALRPDRTYAVTIDDGVLLASDGRSLGQLADRSAWRFTTRAASPRSPSELVVAADGSGDFCSVQGAFDFVPSGNTLPVVIGVRRGTYREIVFVENKGNITLRGDDRAGTVIAAVNNEKLQNGQGAKARALVGFENVHDLVIENLTLHNLTPQGGSQAEALRVDPGERVIVRNASLRSRQDTVLLTGSVYVRDSYVEGNVDYVWGRGSAYFERVELRTIGRPGFTVQARNPADRFGYVFVDSTLTNEPGVVGHLLARVDAERFPGSHVAYVGCRMGPAIAPAGWEVTPPGAPAPGVRFWEADSRDLDGKPLELSRRHPAARRLTRAEAEKMRDKKTVLAGWVPEAG